MDNKGMGIIGVACILNLLSGGWKAKKLGYLPQCVLLYYCGCNGHWDGEGIVTGLNENKLQATLG